MDLQKSGELFDQNSKEYSKDFRLKGYTFDKTQIDKDFISTSNNNYPLDELLDITINHIKLIQNLGIGGAVQTGYKYAYENG